MGTSPQHVVGIADAIISRVISVWTTRLPTIILCLWLVGCAGDDPLRFRIATPQNDLTICKLLALPATNAQTTIEYGKVDDDHKLSFGYSKDRLSIALTEAGYKDYKIFEIQGGFALLTRTRSINPDGSKWSFFHEIP